MDASGIKSYVYSEGKGFLLCEPPGKVPKVVSSRHVSTFVCEYCRESFTAKCNLTNHIRHKHKNVR